MFRWEHHIGKKNVSKNVPLGKHLVGKLNVPLGTSYRKKNVSKMFC